eukprot:jgi/Phyca11/504190/fgenesh2_kg.PHYCAscaffold_6_\
MKMSILSIVLAISLCVAAASDEPACLTEGCNGTREYCDGSIGECRAAQNETECYNATLALFQDGCDVGYECIDDMCRVSGDPVDGGTCTTLCSAGKYCENGSTQCRGPSYDGECFNVATGFFEDGCDDGFYCSFNKCVDISLEDGEGSTVGGSSTTSSSTVESTTITTSSTTSGSTLALDSSEMGTTTGSSSATRSTSAWTSASMLTMILPLLRLVSFSDD